MATLYSEYQKSGNRKGHVPVRPDEEVADLLASLIGAVEANQVRFLTPQTILLGADNSVAFSEREPDSSLYWASPEKVLSGVDLGITSLWFSLGLILHFICEGVSCYENGGYTLVDLPERKEMGPSLLPRRTLSSSPTFQDVLQAAQGLLTSWEPAQREDGVRLLKEAIATFPSEVKLTFQCGGKVVYQEQHKVPRSGLTLSAGDLVTDGSGAWLVMKEQKIPFRTGTHPWTVMVEEIPGKLQARTPPGREPVPYLHIKVGEQPLKRLFQLNQQAQTVDIPFSRKEPASFAFFLVGEDPRTRHYLTFQKVKSLKIRAEEHGGSSILRLNVQPDRKCTISLHTADGVDDPSVYPIHFSL